jgi:hypothetical protein
MRCRDARSKPCSPKSLPFLMGSTTTSRRPERRSPTRPVAGPQARPSRAAAREGPDRLAQIARSGALRPATMGSGLTRSQEATFTRKSFRCWLRRHRADFDPPYREATSATPANRARAEQPRRGRRSRSKAQAASMLRVLTGEERNSSRSHCARDGHRFEPPQLHQSLSVTPVRQGNAGLKSGANQGTDSEFMASRRFGEPPELARVNWIRLELLG